VKFHVSNLISKFGVHTRVSLMHKVATLVMFQSESSDKAGSVFPSFREHPGDPQPERSQSKTPLVMPVERRSGR
jgi:hypothetical protein